MARNPAPAAIVVAFLAVLAWPGAGARAAEDPPPDAQAVAGTPDQPRALSADDLETATAGASAGVNVLSNQQLTATSSGNSISAGTLQSGDIAFSDNAFSGYNGVGNFVFNTGANNNLQGVVSVNIVSAPGP